MRRHNMIRIDLLLTQTGAPTGADTTASVSANLCTMSQLCWVGENLPLTCTVQP